MTGLLRQASVRLSQGLARLQRWQGTVVVLARVPLSQLDEYSTGRLRYALTMLARTEPGRARKLFSSVLRRNGTAGAEVQLELAAMANGVGQPELAAQLLEGAAGDSSPASTPSQTDPHAADAARKLLAVVRGTVDGSLEQALSRQVSALRLADESVTLVPVSGRYLEMWSLWLEQVRRHVGGRVVAMAMDDAALAALQEQADVAVLDIRPWFAWNSRGGLHSHTRGVLWYLRVLLLRELVRQGHTVLLLDLDAMPVGDLQPMLAALPVADVVAQKDYSIPMDVARQFGFVLCCGFMLWRPTPAALTLLDRFAAATPVERDDQLALNHLLSLDGITGRQEDAKCMCFQSAGVQFCCPAPSLVSRSMSEGTVVRHFHQTGQAIAELRAALGLAAQR